MKAWLLALLAGLACGLVHARAELHFWDCGELWIDLQVKEVQGKLKQAAAEEAELRRQLRQANTPVEGNTQIDPKQQTFLKAALLEEAAIKQSYVEQLRSLSEARSNVKNSPQRRFLRAFYDDFRIPSRGNLSGLWRSGPGIPGGSFKLEQVGDSITGSVIEAGCIGYYGPFEVTGTYHDGKVFLTFTGDRQQVSFCHLVLVRDHRGFCLRSEHSSVETFLRPVVPPLAPMK